MILKTLYREAKLYGMTEKNPTIGAIVDLIEFNQFLNNVAGSVFTK
jgi:hypothetical protein